MDSDQPTKRGRGRPKAPPAKRTTVMLPCNLPEMTNAERVTKIGNWLNTVDINLIIKRAAAYCTRKAAGGTYDPIVFQLGGSDGADVQFATRDQQATLRMPKLMHDRILKVSRQLSNRPSDVIRFALTDTLLDNAKRLEYDYVTAHDLGLATTRPRLRQNSTESLRASKKRYLQYSKDESRSEEERAQWLAKAKAIKA